MDVPNLFRTVSARIFQSRAGKGPVRVRKRRPRSAHVDGRGTLDPRAQGWKDAKEAGHAHEHYVAERLRSDLVFSEKLAVQCFGRHMGAPISVQADGKRAKKVPGILGKKTTSKVDIYIEWSGS